MEVIFGSLILVSYGSILFTTIEAININYKFKNEYRNEIANIINISRLRRGFNILMVFQIIFLFLQVLFIFNFILIVEPNNYNFLIIPCTQLSNLIIIISLFFLSLILMIFIKSISNSVKVEVLNEIERMNPKEIKLFLKYIKEKNKSKMLKSKK